MRNVSSIMKNQIDTAHPKVKYDVDMMTGDVGLITKTITLADGEQIIHTTNISIQEAAAIAAAYEKRLRVNIPLHPTKPCTDALGRVIPNL